MAHAPYPPLLAGGERLQAPPMSSDALRRRMAEIYGVEPQHVLPVRGRWHGVMLVLRRAALSGARAVSGPTAPELEKIARLCGLKLDVGDDVGVFASPSLETGAALAPPALEAATARYGLLAIDESLIEFSDAASLVPRAIAASNVTVIRDLGVAYGMMGEPCGALIACEDLISQFEALIEPDALSTTTIATALSVLDASKTAQYARRFAEVRAEKLRIAAALSSSENIADVVAHEGPILTVMARDLDRAQRQLRAYQADFQPIGDALALRLGAPAANDRLLAAFGVNASAASARAAEVVRETLETRIVASVNLDREGGSAVDTGVGFFDHMILQIAAHGGISIQLNCIGDLEIDAHHTIEDCALALGQALKQALGEKRGIGRFGFVLPMDEAEAKVSVDLGGRPYLVFEAAFTAPLIGAYPVEMTEHVFRSLSQTLGASIHVAVTGDNDHHKTEACFKAFGRALRQAVRTEGAALPSTKGMLS